MLLRAKIGLKWSIFARNQWEKALRGFKSFFATEPCCRQRVCEGRAIRNEVRQSSMFVLRLSQSARRHHLQLQAGQ